MSLQYEGQRTSEVEETEIRRRMDAVSIPLSSNYEMRSGSEEGAYVRLIDGFIAQLKTREQ